MTEALHRADEYAPSPDLFARVQRSIEEDGAFRRRRRRALAWIAGGMAAGVTWVALFIDIKGGTVTMPWWSLEILTAAILIAIVIVLGPLIRRFGRVLTLEVFRSNSATSDRFLALLDIAYYLVFSAFVLMSTNFSAQTEWGGRLTAQLELELVRVGGLLLLMGILHAITIAILPVMGLVFASNWRRAARTALGGEAPEADPAAEKADRVATIVVWVAAAGLAGFVLLNLLPVLLGILLGAE